MQHEPNQSKTYQSLRKDIREIRLLILHQAVTDEEVVTCDLRTASLDARPDYEALSYCWGDASDPRDILLAGSKHAVTKNLSGALKALRHPGKPRIIWVDALCINQSDLDERAHQVSMMGDIYRSTTMVRVWLGKDDKEMASHMLSHGKDISRHFDDAEANDSFFYFVRDGMRWWKRAWTAQEAVLAHDLRFHLGRTCMSLSDLRLYAQALDLHMLQNDRCCDPDSLKNLSLEEGFHPFCEAVNELSSKRQTTAGRSYDILEVMDDYKRRNASEVRDKMYAFAGFAHNIPDGFINYRLPLNDCLVHCAKKLIQGTHGLDVLRYKYDGRKIHDHAKPDASPPVKLQRGTPFLRLRIENLPSWCPDWSQSYSFYDVRRQKLYKSLTSSFSSGSIMETSVGFPSETCLTTAGVVCDTVQELPTIGSNPGITPTLRDWRLLVSSFVDGDIICDRCKAVIWAPRLACEACPDTYYCHSCSRSAVHLHKCNSNSQSQDIKIDRAEGPALRRSVGYGTVVQLDDGNFYELRPGVATDSAYGYKGAVDFVYDIPWWVRLRQLPYPFTAGDSVYDAFRKSLTVDDGLLRYFTAYMQVQADGEGSAQPQVTSEASDAVLESFFSLFWHKNVETIPGYEDITEDATTLSSVGLLSANVTLMTEGRQMFVSKQGYIGLGPAHVEKGDLICVFPGASVPFILRKKDQEGQVTPEGTLECTLVGEAYVHGLMHGEASDLVREGKLSMSRFSLY